jgi:hypothetical protein
MLWSANGALANNSPTHSSEHYKANTLNQTNAFMNTTPSAFVNGQVFGVYGVTLAQVQAAESNASHKTHNLTPGWYTVKQGMGPALTFTPGTPGTGYSNNDKVTLTSTITNTVNTGANVLTNASGVVTGFGPFGNNGGLFVNTTSATLAITNTTGGAPNGTGFVGTATFGGRAGRIQREVLVSLGSMTSNSTSANTPLFPNI